MSSNRSDRAIVVVVGGEQDIDEDAGDDDETSREYLRILYLAHCLCWWVFWLGLLAVFWLRKDPKTLVILCFLFVYSPVKLSKRRIKFDQHFPITLHQAAHNARVSPSSLVASTTTLRLQ